MKLLLDECISPRLAPVLQSVLDLGVSEATVYRLDQFVTSGTADDLWVPRAAEARCFVITKDRGRKQHGPPLQLLLPAWNIPAVFCYRKLNNQPSFIQASAIAGVLPAFARLVTEGRADGRYRLLMNEPKLGPRFLLEPWPLTRQERDSLPSYGPQRPPTPGQMF